LLPRYEALNALLFPVGQADLEQARRRFVYEEFFLFQLKMQSLRKMERENSKGKKKEISSVELQEFSDAFPFPLTGAQRRGVDNIMKDMTSHYRMNLLLQGDVGSGKTVVASIAL
ncbi:DNA helicase RecG, partial [Bacillus nitratireducens]|nr:DNA helicase RecG [Bacillus nitratireducens]